MTKVAFITSEIYPFSKTGGLGDVSGSLPKALSNNDCLIKIFTPKYSLIDSLKFPDEYFEKLFSDKVNVSGKEIEYTVFIGKLPETSIDVYFIDSPEYFHRETVYTDDADEDERFIFFNKAVLEVMLKIELQPEIIHVNDWQTCLIPFYVKDNIKYKEAFKNAKTLLTIHNIGYQGRFDSRTLVKAEIGEEYFYPMGPAEFYGDVNFLKLGIVFSDSINTVSRTYAEEILTPEFGAGLSGVLLKRRSDLFGILNGIDDTWNPETDKNLKVNYSHLSLEKKKESKKQLAREMEFEFIPDRPVVAMISRLAIQKGLDLVAEVLLEFIEEDIQFVLLGSGEPEYENRFREFATQYPENVAIHIGYNDHLAHVIEAGADIFLMPSRYEPCGLNQMYSLKYGTVPVVRKTGGLADTVFDWDEARKELRNDGNGFSFVNYNIHEFRDALYRALKYFKEPATWKLIQRNGMIMDFSWNNSAKKYKSLYNLLLKS